MKLPKTNTMMAAAAVMTLAVAARPSATDPRLSPDGRTVLYAVRTTDVDANRRATTTYLKTLGAGAPRAFPDDTTHAGEARWSPDGRRVAYTAGGQLWVVNADGSGRKQLTTLNGGAVIKLAGVTVVAAFDMAGTVYLQGSSGVRETSR